MGESVGGHGTKNNAAQLAIGAKHLVPVWPLLALIGLLLVLTAGKSAADTGTLPPVNPERLHPALRRALLDSVALPSPPNLGGKAVPPEVGGLGERWPPPTEIERTSDGFLPVVVEWRREPSIAAQASSIPDRLARRQEVVAILQADAQRNSSALQADLQAASVQGLARNVRAFWISPVIALEARPELIAALSQRVDVVQIRPDERLYLEDTAFKAASAPQAASGLPWNLIMLNVGLVRDALGLDGTGVVVSNLDTGVDWQHPALLSKYRGYRGDGLAVHQGNWHVSTNEPYLYPGDGNGHGTHTMGTMVGEAGDGNRTGVAPGARWIAVKLFTNLGYTYESWIHDAFQWIIAPEGDPALAPDVIDNSWGSTASGDDRYRPDLKAVRAAGILPIFSAGNEGPGISTIDSPGSYPEALTVGAVDEDKAVASFSGRGPSPWDEIKPELVAPGTNVLSTFPGGAYAEGTGTSMAAPHVAGLAALLLQANPKLTPDQIEQLLMTTAEPLGAHVPNNATGRGLINAYTAGLQVTASGELMGRVVRPDGGGIAQATVTAAQRDGSQAVKIGGDAYGNFTLALRPGRYDVTASAFGFEPATRYGAEVATGVRTSLAITLTAQPAGSLFGRVTDLQTGAPLSATITVEGTPVRAQTEPNTGLYSLVLPAGDYRATVTATAHRIGRLEETVVAGVGRQSDMALPRGPHILLVDSGAWYYQSQIRYFEDALDALDYPFSLWTIRDPFGQRDGTSDRPTANDLSSYDTVIWSAPSDSPGLIGAGDVITSYLHSGGHLLVTGQDVAFWDAGGTLLGTPSAYLMNDMGLRFSAEGNLANLTGVPATPFEGMTLALNTPDSSMDQYTLDSVEISNGLLTHPAFRWPDEGIGAATAGTCRPYRAAWLGFGLEGAGPQPARIETLGRLLDWFAVPPARYGLVATSTSAPLVGLPGTAVSQTIRLDSIGIMTDTIHLQTDGGPWRIDLELPDGRHVQGDATFVLPGCASATMTATVTIPPDLGRDARSVHLLHLASQGDPAVSVAVTVTAKTPAPILFVDDDRWFNYQDRYTTTLSALDLSYDYFDTLGSRETPSTETLKRYHLVVWATGYDWLSPLTLDDESHLGAYLDGGGRLLLSSQDLLDVRGTDDFVRGRLGVAEATLTITPTEVLDLPGNPLGTDLGPWRLTFPFQNWGDGLFTSAPASGVLQDQHQATVGVVRPGGEWRTAFFSFPLEALDDAARRTLLGRTLVWLSPLGESRLDVPAFAAEGSDIPMTLTLSLGSDRPRTGLRAVVPLLPETHLVPGSLRGPWDYDPAANALAWSGELSPGITLTLGAGLSLSTGIPDGTALPLRARLYAGDGITLTAEAPVRVDVPWLTLAEQVEPAEAPLGGTARYTITVTNAGTLSTAAHLTDTLPTGLTLVKDSVWAEQGFATANGDELDWSGTVAPGATTEIGYVARVTLSRLGARLVDRIELVDDFARRVVGWATVLVWSKTYLPVVTTDGQ